MDRKGIIAVALAVIGLISWQIYYTRETQKALRAQQEAAAIAAAAAPAETAASVPAATPAPAPATTVAAPETPPIEAPTAVVENLSTDAVDYAFTNLGGGIASALLKQHLAEKEEKVRLNEFGIIPIGAVTEAAGEAINQPFTSSPNAAAGEMAFERTDARQVQMTKRFVLPKVAALEGKEKLRDEYLVRLDLTFTNHGAQPAQMPPYYVHTGSAAPVHEGDLPTYTGFNWFRASDYKFIDVNWFGSGGFLMFGHPERPIYSEAHDNIRWAGVTNQYFTSIVSAVADEKASSDLQAKQRGVSVWARRFKIDDEKWRAAGHSMTAGTERFGVDGALGMPAFTLAAGQSATQSFHLYVGPREYRRLRELGNHESEIMNFGMFAIVSTTLLNAMNTFRGWFGNYAWAIIVLTLVIKTLMWPLQNKATNSMKRMSLLQPEMTKLREKYKDDPTRMNTELMKLYKDYKINPMSGCLPMLVQIPIFFGFYNMLGPAVELRNSKFLWVQDLSQPDTIAHLAGIPLNPLPLLMAATMFWQMAISPKSGDPIQQRVFMFVPLIFIFFCYNFASALALYWTVQNLFSIVQLYATRNQAGPTLQKVTAPPPTPPPGKKKRRG